MNNKRRKEIRDLYPDCEALGILADAVKAAIAAFNEAAEQMVEDINFIRDGEQEYIDNLPENLQQSEKAQIAEDAVNALDEAIGMVTNVDDFENWSKDDLIGKLDEAVGQEA